MLTTGELQQLLEAQGADLALLPETPLDTLLTNVGSGGRLHGVRGGAGTLPPLVPSLQS